MHYNPLLSLVLATDASSTGVGAVFSHRQVDGSESPIAFASKTLNSAERNYSQTEKEALSIMFGLDKFYQYLSGRHFLLLTDHQPLTAIFNPSKALPAHSLARLQRWAIKLMAFDYTIEYRSTKAHGNADALSRLPLADEAPNDTSSINLVQMEMLDSNLLDCKVVAQETLKDPTLAQVSTYVKNGWPQQISKSSELYPYFQVRSAIIILSPGVLCLNDRVLYSLQLRNLVLQLLHTAHPGPTRMKQHARLHVCWPGINSDITKLASACEVCAQHAINPLSHRNGHNKQPHFNDFTWILPTTMLINTCS